MGCSFSRRRHDWRTTVKIDNTSPEHAYLQLAAQLRELIVCGQIASKLPSLTELTAQTHLATGTIRRAIDVLIREHLVQTVPGRGTFVTSTRPPER